MSEKNFDWFMIHYKGQWRVYRDKSIFPWGLPVTCANTPEKAIKNLENYLGDDCPSFIIQYERKIKADNDRDAYDEFWFGPRGLIDKLKNWISGV